MRRVAVVTGGGSGIGRAIVSGLVEDSYDVAIVDIAREAAERTAAELTTNGRLVRAYLADVSDRDAVTTIGGQIASELGVPSVIVNNAGWSAIQSFVDNDASCWNKAIGINLMGTITVTHAFVGGLIGLGAGRIINVASDAGRVGSTGEVVYSAAKGGVIAFTKALAREMAKHRINVNCVCPGPTTTPMLLVQDQKRIDALTRAIPFGRLAEPIDIAKAVPVLRVAIFGIYHRSDLERQRGTYYGRLGLLSGTNALQRACGI